jgi:diguanylate cyclase
VLGAIFATWLCWSHFRHKAIVQNKEDAHHAAKILMHLQELATRVAIDVDKHTDSVEEISETLNAAKEPEPGFIVDVVAKLIQANQQMHKKLATTENKLREQAEKIQTSAAEARTDSLTLLVNRRAFDDELVRRCAEFRRSGHTFSLIMADLDNFKQINDARGHQAGDEVLRGAAKLLRRKMREMDLVARYGGEEFAIILPNTNLVDAERAAFRACEGFQKFQINFEGTELAVTVSFGVAETVKNESGDSIVSRADKALYAAKDAGRNCVFRHDGTAVVRSVAPKKPDLFEMLLPEQGKPSETGIIASEDAAAKTAEAQHHAAHAEDLEHLASLASRSSFCQQVRSRTAEWRRGGPTFSVALVEVNQYDKVAGNDARQTRDEAAITAFKYLISTVREMDVIGRYAAGCFALLMPTAKLADAIRVAERLREGFSQACLGTDGVHPKLTLSVGVVQIFEKDDSISVLKRAEAALDAADRRGGDRAYYHDGERCAPITAMMETMDYLS